MDSSFDACFVRDSLSLCSSGWPETCCVDKFDLELNSALLASAPVVFKVKN